MPIIELKIWIEKELENSSLKHYLNSEDFDILSAKEDDNLFALHSKKPSRFVLKVKAEGDKIN